MSLFHYGKRDGTVFFSPLHSEMIFFPKYDTICQDGEEKRNVASSAPSWTVAFLFIMTATGKPMNDMYQFRHINFLYVHYVYIEEPIIFFSERILPC